MRFRSTDRPGKRRVAPEVLLAFSAFLVALAGGSIPVDAGLVITRTERIEGEVEIDGGGVRAGEARFPWDDVLYLLANEEKRTIGEPHAVRLQGGEVWRVVIESLEAGKLRIASPLFGRKEIASDAVVEIDFAPSSRASRVEVLEPLEDAVRPAAAGSLARGELHRRDGGPVPGELLAISAEHVAIQSPLGVLRVPREDAVRWVVGRGTADGRGTGAEASRVFPEGRTGPDEVSLIDGSVIRGRLLAKDGRLVLEHPVLGSLEVSPALLRSVVRHPADVMDLTEVPATAKLFPLVTETVREGLPVVLRNDAPRDHVGEASVWVEALRLEPRTVARFELPEIASGMRLRFLATLSARALGDARLIVRAGDRVLLEKRLDARRAAAASSPSRADFVELDLPREGALILEAAFGELVLFPNTVLLGDPHILLDGGKGGPGAAPDPAGPDRNPRAENAPGDTEGRR